MSRAVRALIVTLTIGMLAAPLPATAQSGAKIPRIGIESRLTEAVLDALSRRELVLPETAEGSDGLRDEGRP